MNRFELRTAGAIGLLYIVRMLGLFMVLPVLPLLADGIEAATPLLIGLAIGIYGLSQAVLQIPLGILSDRIGRKPVIYGGLVVFVVGSFVAAFATDIYGVSAGRLLQGCGAIASTLLALVADVTRIEHRSKAMAIVGISIGGSFGMALILGPFIAARFGLSGIFLFTGAAGLVGLVLVATLINNPLVRSRDPNSSVSLARILPILSDRDLARTVFGIFSLHYLLMSSFIALPLLMTGTGRIDLVDHAQVYFWVLLLSFVLMLPFIWMADRARFTKPLLLAMIAVLAGAALLLSEARAYYPVLLGMLVFFMGFNLLEVILPALVSKFSPVGERGTAMGVYSTAQFAGGFVGATVGGMILGMADITYLMYANALLCFGWAVYASGMASPGNLRTITGLVTNREQLSASEVADALLSVHGVMDVALVDDGRLAYLRVNDDEYDADGMSHLQTPSLEVISK